MRKRPGLVLFLGGLALLCGTGAWLFKPAAPPKHGRLVPERAVIVLDPAGKPRTAGERAKATFTLRNDGEEPVTIQGVRSGCDCASAEAQPSRVGPGESAHVDVEVDPERAGQKTVGVTVLSDSPVMPEVNLFLAVRQPTTDDQKPYLYRAGGDLSYSGDWSPTEPRTVHATTFHPRGREKVPTVVSDLPFLAFELAGFTEEETTNPSVIGGMYQFSVLFKTIPPPGPFSGVVAVADPWDESAHKTIRIVGVVPPPLQAVPERLILSVAANAGAPTAAFRVTCWQIQPTLEAVPEASEKSPLRVEPHPAEDGASTFRVGLDPARQEAWIGIHNVIVRASVNGAETHRLVVPVMVKREGPS